MYGDHSSVGRAADCGSAGRGFDPRWSPLNYEVTMTIWYILKAEKDQRLNEEHHSKNLAELTERMHRLIELGYKTSLTEYKENGYES